MKKVFVAFLTVFMILLAIVAVQAYAVPLMPALQVAENEVSVTVTIPESDENKKGDVKEDQDEEEVISDTETEITEEPTETEEVVETTEEPTETEEVVETTEEPTETEEVVETTEVPTETEEVVETTEVPTETEEVVETTEVPTETVTEVVVEPTEEPTEIPTEVPTEVVDREVFVTIKGNTAYAAYDGNRHVASGYTVTEISNSAYTENDFIFTGQAYVEMIDAGVSYMGLTGDMFINKNNQFDVYFEIEDGYVEVSPINVEIEVIGVNETTEYDGNTHVVEGYTFRQIFPIGMDLYDEDSFEFLGNAHAERNEAGISFMGLNGSSFRNINPNFGRVLFHVTDGYIEITPSEEMYEEPVEEIIEPTEEPTETTVDETVEPTEEPTETTVDETVEPTEEPTETTVDETVEPTEEPTETTVNETVEPTEEPTETTVDETVEPIEEPTETTVDETVEPTEEPTETTVDETVEPTEEPTETTVDETVEPTEEPTETTVDETVEPTEEPTETTVDGTVEPTEEPTEEVTVQTITLSAETVIYSAADEESEVLVTLEEDAEFTVLNKDESGWVEIQLSDEVSGFVKTEPETVEPTEEPTEEIGEPTEEPTVQTIILAAETVIYSAADEESEVLVTLEEDAEFTVLNNDESGWVEIQLSDEVSGFVKTEPETETEEPVEEVTETPAAEEPVEVILLTAGTNIYSDADEESEILKVLEEDTEFTIVVNTELESDWLEIQLDPETIGFVVKPEEQPEDVDEDEEVSDGKIAVTAGVNVRAAADGMSEIIYTFEEDSRVTVVSKEGDWLLIEGDGVTGYIFAGDVKTDDEEKSSEDDGRKVTIFTSRRIVMPMGSDIELTSLLEGFEESDTITYQWECDKGQGFEPIDGANGDSYTYKASVESLTWGFRLNVTVETESDSVEPAGEEAAAAEE